jgi:hypothetical protein
MAPWRDPTSGAQGTRAFAWAVAAHVLVATSLAVSYGHYQPVASVLVFAAVGALGLGLRAARRPAPAWPFAHALVWSVALASAASVGLLAPGIYLAPNTSLVPVAALASVASAVVASYWFDLRPAPHVPRWLACARPAAMLALALALGAWLLHASPAPSIDVWALDQQAADALLHGRRVYGHAAVAAIDTHDPSRTIDVYVYPPLTLLLSTASFALTGETRWAKLVAILAGAALLRTFAKRTTKDDVLADLLMACLLFHPRGLFVLEQSWGEPLALPFLGAFAVAMSAGRTRWAAVMLGLLCAVKQHFLLYLPALALSPGVGRLRGSAIALAVVAATYFPFVASSPRDLWASVVVHHMRNPFRPDSLSLPAMISGSWIVLPAWLGFAATAASLAVLRWTPREVGPLLLASSLQFILFYVFGRQAFCNYYYLIGATWLFAAAALTSVSHSRRSP